MSLKDDLGEKKGIVKGVEKTIFSGYVFLDMQMSFEKYYKLKEILRFLRK